MMIEIARRQNRRQDDEVAPQQNSIMRRDRKTTAVPPAGHPTAGADVLINDWPPFSGWPATRLKIPQEQQK